MTARPPRPAPAWRWPGTRHIGAPLVGIALTLIPGCASRTPWELLPTGVNRPLDAPYQVRPGDSLDVRFYYAPELNVTVPVRSDGMISLELVGDVHVQGMAPEDLAKHLSELYARELLRPEVSVSVSKFGGQVYIGGEVKTPVIVPYEIGLTALQAITAAGGFTENAHADSVVLIRRTRTGDEGYTLQLGRVLRGEDLASDVPLLPADVVYVPRSRIANLNNFVDLYVRRNLPINPAIVIPAF